MKKILIIIIPLILILIIFIIKKRNPKDNVYKKLLKKEKTYDELLKVVYNSSGDMNGNINRHEFDVKNKRITTEYRTEMGEDIKVIEYKLNEEDIKIIKEYIDKYNFPMWNELKVNENLIELDAAPVNISFFYDNSKLNGNSFATYTISYDYDIPNIGRENLSEFKKYLFSLETNENKIKEYIEKD